MRKKIKANLVRLIGCDAKDIFLADWDKSRIAWEETNLSTWYHSHPNEFQEVLDKATEGTGYFIELINSCEGSLCKI